MRTRTPPTSDCSAGSSSLPVVGSWRCRARHSASSQDPEWSDNILFNEHFHGDNGAGPGALHQTGWMGVVADLILRSRGEHIATLGELLEPGMQTMQ